MLVHPSKGNLIFTFEVPPASVRRVLLSLLPFVKYSIDPLMTSGK